MKIALLTDKDHRDLIIDEEHLVSQLEDNGINAKVCVWDESHNWSEFDAVIIRSTWDYSFDYDNFIKVLSTISKDSKLFNSFEVVKWNSSKDYLQKLESIAIKQVPTTRCQNFKSSDITNYFEKNDFQSIVLKPTVGLGGIDTFKISRDDTADYSTLEGRDFLIQPFLESIVFEGEYSFICFNGVFSHAVVKNAKKGEFRVQDDHGGTVQSYLPTDAQVKASEDFLKDLDSIPLYARIDVVNENGQLYLMELELIEPELFFRYSDNGMKKFSDALKERLNDDSPS